MSDRTDCLRDRLIRLPQVCALIERASRLLGHVYVGIFYNPAKSDSFIEQRVRMVEGALAHLENIEPDVRPKSWP